MQTSPESKFLIIADAHLPLDGRSGAEAELRSFTELIKAHQDTLHTLLLLGDTFDFWFEWRHVVPARAFGVLSLLHELVARGVHVRLFAGNHDFQLGPFWRSQVGAHTHLDAWTATLDSRRYYFHHGDGLAASDRNYRRMKAVFRNRVAQALFRTLIHPDLAMEIGRIASAAGGPKDSTGDAPPDIFAEYQAAARRILRQGHDVVMFGHMHHAFIDQLPEGHFVNPGPFLHERRYAVIEGGLPSLRIWE